jgi:hypothetical protein
VTKATTKPALLPGPIIRISGGDHLHEFTSFSVKAVRSFDATKPGHRCLRGPFLRVDGERTPPMNIATHYLLPANATAVYLFGKSAAGAAHDVHAALVHEPGSQVVLPLSVATPEKQQAVTRLAALLQHAEFVVARTMPENPHCYTRRQTWASDEDFLFAVSAIRRYGHREKYVPPGAVRAAYSETVFASGEHFYWSGYLKPEDTHWINRKVLPVPVLAALVDQTVMVENARLLEIPDLPDGFAGLDTTITRCRHFQAGCHLFGYVAPA